MWRLSCSSVQSTHQLARIGYTTIATTCTSSPHVASSRIVLNRLQSTLLTPPVLSSLSDTQHHDIIGQVHTHLDMMGILAVALKANEEALLARNKVLEQEWLELKQDVSELKQDMLELKQAMLEWEKASKRI
jgi:hypothetical protein